MAHVISPLILEQWLKAWCLSRKLPLPVPFKSGFKVDVGYEKQKVRYVFPQLYEDFFELANHIDEAWIFLKVCAQPTALKGKIPEKWVIQPQGYMMSCFEPMKIPNIELPEGFKLEFTISGVVSTLKIIAPNGDLATSGHLVLTDDLAVYDRIQTEIGYRRRGLAILLMKELEKIALSKSIFKNFLVATEEGKSLYQFLGWELHSFYTSIVIEN
ncbi:hypothetical protein VRU48_04280 [Pedobacter sp. KR3-3]|uniref:GNAT family N-acetyltransferase n=1 Tax=Pedobacter albus TaxID=3113905 RepID=A0ABU7I4B4_9SPHI|nr:hypothetical protein [Pedobacter sp. KR3-3]MEE1944311.1 hypothetical protein [Pedobacter sp. KR3-3]